jgi:hypothetical protein
LKAIPRGPEVGLEVGLDFRAPLIDSPEFRSEALRLAARVHGVRELLLHAGATEGEAIDLASCLGDAQIEGALLTPSVQPRRACVEFAFLNSRI